MTAQEGKGRRQDEVTRAFYSRWKAMKALDCIAQRFPRLVSSLTLRRAPGCLCRDLVAVLRRRSEGALAGARSPFLENPRQDWQEPHLKAPTSFH
jgi:hypothetical protein